MQSDGQEERGEGVGGVMCGPAGGGGGRGGFAQPCRLQAASLHLEVGVMGGLQALDAHVRRHPLL